MNRFISILAGVIVGGIVIFLMELINQLLYPLPAGIDIYDPKQREIIMQFAPAGALLMIVFGWLFGSLVAGAITKLISEEKKLSYSLISGAILMAMGLIQLLSFFHPLWVWVTGLTVFIPAAFLGYKLVRVKTLEA